MNNFIVRLFVFITEVLSAILIGLTVLVGLVMMTQNFVAGLAVAIGGPIFVTVIFGFAAIFIEIHKDLRAMRERADRQAAS